MGREAKTLVDDGRTRGEARLHLDSETLTIGPPFRLKLRLNEIAACTVEGDALLLGQAARKITITLPAKEAAGWAKAILKPPSLATKLGLKPGQRLAVIGEMPPEITALTGQTKPLARITSKLQADLLFVAIPAGDQSKRLADVAKALPSGAAAWLIYEKGVTNGDTLIFAARAAGLKDTKVAKISERFAALRFIGTA